MPQNNVTKRLGLGTVQFGIDYGVTNSDGKVKQSEVKAILSEASSMDINLLDTASLYGTSETMLGDVLKSDKNWQIVTKTPKFSDVKSGKIACKILRETFEQSLDKLKQKSIYALLIHDVEDLFTPFGELLINEMQLLKKSGLINKIGVSIYSGNQIKKILEFAKPDIIQLPYNSVDQRLHKSGILSNLAKENIEIHARSIFLQGLLLTPANKIDKRYKMLSQKVEGLNIEYKRLNLTPLEGSIGAVLQRKEISKLIFGVTTKAQFIEVTSAAKKVEKIFSQLDIEHFAIEDETIINPANWPNLL